jgi:purine-nucleoside phosphorylase
MTAVAPALKGAICVDFTGSASGYQQLKAFGDEFVSLVRQAPGKPIVIIDRAVGGDLQAPVVVRDHLNMTGTSPLLGPNHPCGERFPVVQGIYVEEALPELQRVVVAGLHSSVRPDAADVELVNKFGATVCCYNVVPAMLVAAHAKSRVLAVVLPPGQSSLSADLAKQIQALIGEKA